MSSPSKMANQVATGCVGGTGEVGVAGGEGGGDRRIENSESETSRETDE